MQAIARFSTSPMHAEYTRSIHSGTDTDTCLLRPCHAAEAARRPCNLSMRAAVGSKHNTGCAAWAMHAHAWKVAAMRARSPGSFQRRFCAALIFSRVASGSFMPLFQAQRVRRSGTACDVTPSCARPAMLTSAYQRITAHQTCSEDSTPGSTIQGSLHMHASTTQRLPGTFNHMPACRSVAPPHCHMWCSAPQVRPAAAKAAHVLL